MSVTAPDFIRAGLTYRRLDHWTTCQYLQPEGDANPGTGRSRCYPYSELRIARLMVQLTDAGIEPATAARLARRPVEGAAELRRLADMVEAGA